MRFKTGMLVLLFTTVLLCTPSWAIMLSFNPTTSSIGTGETLDVDVVISDMQEAYLGAFDFNVNFDGSILSFESYTLGNELGEIDLFEAEDWSLGYSGGNTLHLSELSWLWDLSFQPDAFTLATISFSGAGAGTSALTFSDVILSDDWAFPLQAELNAGLVDVTAPVPEPATIFLLGTGMIGLIGARRKFKK